MRMPRTWCWPISLRTLDDTARDAKARRKISPTWPSRPPTCSASAVKLARRSGGADGAATSFSNLIARDETLTPNDSDVAVVTRRGPSACSVRRSGTPSCRTKNCWYGSAYTPPSTSATAAVSALHATRATSCSLRGVSMRCTRKCALSETVVRGGARSGVARHVSTPSAHPKLAAERCAAFSAIASAGSASSTRRRKIARPIWTWRAPCKRSSSVDADTSAAFWKAASLLGCFRTNRLTPSSLILDVRGARATTRASHTARFMVRDGTVGWRGLFVALNRLAANEAPSVVIHDRRAESPCGAATRCCWR
jgi:hypothetical protein